MIYSLCHCISPSRYRLCQDGSSTVCRKQRGEDIGKEKIYNLSLVFHFELTHMHCITIEQSWRCEGIKEKTKWMLIQEASDFIWYLHFNFYLCGARQLLKCRRWLFLSTCERTHSYLTNSMHALLFNRLLSMFIVTIQFSGWKSNSFRLRTTCNTNKKYVCAIDFTVGQHPLNISMWIWT